MILTTILTLAVAFFSLIALMIIHEFGHFIIAKKFGVRILDEKQFLNLLK